ncbi:hypothetical protein [Natronococcus sp. A-GB7]|uniref:hypothetical protein n=1 Tax=Natronococcus sp. A-GB7 TaxID=3037649 RepID=UPI0024204987|nr:hypothetical protein [Natronococcus sp. A-GB7]MDG5817433.1 hypothetical protein [Natronococcus sp. A-GB7]
MSDDETAGPDSTPVDDANDGIEFTTPAVDDASGYGLSMTLLGGVLLALAYYGYLAVSTVGFGAVPEPFYVLALALLFVVELFRSPGYDGEALVRAVAFTAVYGGLVVFAIEGGAYLFERPEAALEGFVGVTVLAVSIVVAALAYFLFLAVVKPSLAAEN